ncbi:MAG: TRAP transporter large permease [Castellaniella sp.]
MDIYIGVGGIFMLFFLILIGANVMVALGAVGLIGSALIVGFPAAASMFSTTFYHTAHSFEFSVIPMFLLMGYFAFRANLGSDIFKAVNAWMGGIRGGLAISTTLASAGFGAASGSSIGTAMLFTKIALPEMLSRGYNKSLASASIAIAGTLAVMIPPSTVVIIYGILTDASIGKLLIAGVIPGLVFGVVLCITIYITVRLKPSLAPTVSHSVSLRDKFLSLRHVGPLLLVILIIIVGLYVGFFTPTEAGAVGAALVLLIALVRRRSIKALHLRSTLLETTETTAMIFAVIICALVFSRFLALSGVTGLFNDMFDQLGDNRLAVLGVVTLIYLVLGTMMDAPSLLAISLPLTHPVMMKMGFDPIWFGVYVVLLVEVAAITPPVGINCFVVQAASGGRLELEDIFRGIVPFLIASAAMLALLYIFPQLALFLPSNM